MNELLKKIMTVLLLAALAMPIGAAKDSGAAPDDDLNEGHHTPGYGSIAYEISLTANPDEIKADGTSKSKITAQLTDKKGKSIKTSGVTITFVTNKGTLLSTSATTDSNGKASVYLKSSTQTETAKITATSVSVVKGGKTEVKFIKAKPKEDKEDKDKKDKEDKDKKGKK